MINIIDKECPMCESEISDLKISSEIDPIKNKDLLEKYWRGFYKDKLFFSYHRCSCGLLYNKKFFDNSSLRKLYSSMDDNIHGDIFSDNLTRDYYIKVIKDLKIVPNSKILEIGADNGSFSKKLYKAFIPSKIDVVEPNTKMEIFLKSIANKHYKDIHEISNNEEYDLIVAIHVLDHLADLKDFMNKINNLLKEDGNLIIIVHNELSLLSKILGKRWPAYCLQHPHLFNKSSLTDLMKNFNLCEIKIQDTVNYFKFGYLLRHFFLALFKIDIKFPGMFTVGLKLGNIIGIYNKKKKD